MGGNRQLTSHADGPVIFDPAAPGSIETASEWLAAGRVLVIPTDTVYGVAASLNHPDALRRIFALKGRDPGKPLPILVSTSGALDALTPDLDPDINLLLQEYWPGPLTVALPGPLNLPREVVAADGSIGVRMPNHRLAIELIERSGGAVACTSANISGESPALTAREAVATLGTSVDGAVAGGIAPGGVPSTVIGFDADGIVLLREGAIPIDRIRSTWDELRGDRG
jgi:L-threonylcarbamoyladenylate synthase